MADNKRAAIVCVVKPEPPVGKRNGIKVARSVVKAVVAVDVESASIPTGAKQTAKTLSLYAIASAACRPLRGASAERARTLATQASN